MACLVARLRAVTIGQDALGHGVAVGGTDPQVTRIAGRALVVALGIARLAHRSDSFQILSAARRPLHFQ